MLVVETMGGGSHYQFDKAELPGIYPAAGVKK